MSPPDQKVSTMLLGKSRGQLLIAPERMKRLGQSRNNAQLLLCLVVKVKSDAAAAAKSLQSCPTLCDPTDGSPPGFPVPGILQAKTLEWVAISFSNAGK